MIEVFRNWINLLLCLGIFITILQLVMPKSKLRKYIYSLVGVITMITIVSPVMNMLEQDSMEDAIAQVISNMDMTSEENVDIEKYQQVNQDAVKKTFVSNLKRDIKDKLNTHGIEMKKSEVFVNSNYEIEKIEIHIGKLNQEDGKISSVTQVVKYLNEEYDVDISKIVVVEEGE